MKKLNFSNFANYRDQISHLMKIYRFRQLDKNTEEGLFDEFILENIDVSAVDAVKELRILPLQYYYIVWLKYFDDKDMNLDTVKNNITLTKKFKAWVYRTGVSRQMKDIIRALLSRLKSIKHDLK